MPRKKSLERYDQEILEVQKQMTRAKNRYEALSQRLAVLQKKKKQQEINQIMEAYGKSNRSLKEVMIFLED